MPIRGDVRVDESKHGKSTPLREIIHFEVFDGEQWISAQEAHDRPMVIQAAVMAMDAPLRSRPARMRLTNTNAPHKPTPKA